MDVQTVQWVNRAVFYELCSRPIHQALGRGYEGQDYTDLEVCLYHGAEGEVMHHQVFWQSQGCIHCLCHALGTQVIRAVCFPEGRVGPTSHTYAFRELYPALLMSMSGAIRSAMALPIPLAAPVRMTALSFNVSMKFSYKTFFQCVTPVCTKIPSLLVLSKSTHVIRDKIDNYTRENL